MSATARLTSPVHRLATVAPRSGLRSWWQDWRQSLVTGALAAVILALVAEAAALLFSGGPSAFAELLRHPEHAVGVWNRYDTVWYVNVATDGYGAHTHDPSEAGTFADATAFPPLFPLLIAGTAALLHIAPLSAGLLVSFLTLPPALAVFHRLAVRDLGVQRGRTALLLLLCAPAAFFLIAPYGAGLLLLLVSGALLAARDRRWAVAGVLAALCLLCKVYEGIVALAVALEYMEARGWSWRTLRAGAAWTLAPTVLALGGWALYLGVTLGDPLRFLHAQAGWSRTLSAPWTAITTGVAQISQAWGVDAIAAVRMLELGSLLLLGALAVYAYRRMRRSDAALLGLSCLLIAATGRVDATHRFLLATPPVFTSLALLARRRAFVRLLCGAGALLGVFLLHRFVTGAWAG